MAEYFADDGTVITEAIIDRWAVQADEAFQTPEIALTSFEGRAWETSTSPMRPRTIRVPDALWGLIEDAAHRRNISVSQYAREALTKDLMAV
jgi:hypothetical protein